MKTPRKTKGRWKWGVHVARKIEKPALAPISEEDAARFRKEERLSTMRPLEMKHAKSGDL